MWVLSGEIALNKSCMVCSLLHDCVGTCGLLFLPVFFFFNVLLNLVIVLIGLFQNTPVCRVTVAFWGLLVLFVRVTVAYWGSVGQLVV